MNLQQTAAIFSLIPILGYVLNTLFNVLCDDSESSKLLKDEKENDEAIDGNLAAQKHFRQLQHFRGA
ncbi:hypothetical protein RND71_022220 [Anisodus tanguticus]|uniref:Uncharacterized protein n=1 Tax=Anisodus tanguticus TaxID=243964 RepID=A0AAE1RZZ9_9SOLA|nr:hypothetical protein RND71_022220 [Anisodus tanguticus]